MKTDEELLGYTKQRNAKLLAADPAHRVYLDELQRRADAYAAHVLSMDLSPEIVHWSLSMARQYGSYVLMTHFVADWITALLIIRYGEEPDAARSTDPNFQGWPHRFTDTDTQRALKLMQRSEWTSMMAPCTEAFK